MTESLHTLFSKASALDQADRAALAGLLIDSLDPVRDEAVEAAWAAEVERRVRELDQGQVAAVSWDTLRDRLDARAETRACR